MNREQFEKEWEAAGRAMNGPAVSEPEPALESEPKPQKETDPLVGLWKQQTVICLLLLVAAVAIRYVNADVYQYVRSGYINRFCDVTSPSQVVDEEPSTVTPDEVPAMATVTATDGVGADLGDSVDDSLAVTQSHLLLTGTTVQNKLVVPVNGTVTSPFGYRIHPIYGTRLFHNGVDIGADQGTPVVAAMSGWVEKAEYSDSYGYYVILNHGNDFCTVYAHCSALQVTQGAWVEQGDEIALVGSTGVATGPHLHFEVRRGEYKIDPSFLVALT